MKTEFNLNKKEKILTVIIELPDGEPIYKHGNRGRVIGYKNLQSTRRLDVSILAQEEFEKEVVVLSMLQGPKTLRNIVGEERKATWVFKVDLLEEKRKPAKRTKSTKKTTAKKTKR